MSCLKTKANSKSRILFVSPEVDPFVKTGGLADVAGSLPKALLNMGYAIAIALPLYGEIFSSKFPLDKLADIQVPMGEEFKEGSLYRSYLDNEISVFLVSQKDYFHRENLYGDENGDYPDNAERFSFFCKTILLALKKIGWKPQIIHCNDWQTALICLYLKVFFSQDDFYRNIGTLFTIHNLAYQGIFAREKLKAMDLKEEFFVANKLDFNGRVNTMKAGLVFADLISTVSPTYSREIQTPEYGFGLDDVLRQRKNNLYGILNGIDYQTWDPSRDKKLTKNYSWENPKGKDENKKALQKENNLPVTNVPLVALISRLSAQKGLDLIVEGISELMQLPLQLIVLGRGDYRYNRMFEQIGRKFPQKTGVHIDFDRAMAKRVYAGADLFLMPSRYEPCGLGQMISLRYGTIPVVRKTGGLADTVREFDPATGKGEGFVFEEYSSQEMIVALRRATDVYENKDVWEELIKNGMKQDFSWNRSAGEYSRIYRVILDKLGKGR